MSDVLSQIEFATIVECWMSGSRFYEPMLLHDAALRTNARTAEARVSKLEQEIGEAHNRESALAFELQEWKRDNRGDRATVKLLTATILETIASLEDAAEHFRRSRAAGTLDVDPENIATATAVRLRQALAKE